MRHDYDPPLYLQPVQARLCVHPKCISHLRPPSFFQASHAKGFHVARLIKSRLRCQRALHYSKYSTTSFEQVAFRTRIFVQFSRMKSPSTDQLGVVRKSQPSEALGIQNGGVTSPNPCSRSGTIPLPKTLPTYSRTSLGLGHGSNSTGFQVEKRSNMEQPPKRCGRWPGRSGLPRAALRPPIFLAFLSSPSFRDRGSLGHE